MTLRGFLLYLAIAIIGLLGVRCSPRGEAEVIETSGSALEASTCAGVTSCGQRHRACVDSGGRARCGACLGGFVESPGRTCEAARTCAALSCEQAHRKCDALPNAFCKDECVDGYVWDPALRACRVPKTCADAACAPYQSCTQRAGADAQCAGAACPSGQGWDPVAKACVGCAGGGAPLLCGQDSARETGNVLAVAGKRCVCESRDKYFVPSVGTAAVACDADGDGWVNDAAQPVLEGTDPALRANARCNVRRVWELVLQSDEGAQYYTSTEEFLEQLGGLPLYESARNDGATPGVPAPYAALAGGAAAINSLTKACVGTAEDFNGNGVADVDEDQSANIDATLGTRTGTNDKLLAYYRIYARYSYFIELANGWYEPAETNPAWGPVYRIQERRREGGQLPVNYAAGTPDYWRQCPRHKDVLYSPGSALSRTGGDFTASFLGSFDDMGHESQFKCVVVHQDGSYPAGATEVSRPQSFAVSAEGKLQRKNAQGAWKGYAWAPNACQPRSLAQPPGIVPTNPSIPSIDCTAGVALDRTKTTVLWAAVVGLEYAPDPATGAPTYQRGCVDMCKESPNGNCARNATCGAGAGACSCPPGYLLAGDVSSPSGVCYPNKCATNNGGCSPDATCTNDVNGGDPSCVCRAGYQDQSGGKGKDCLLNLCPATCMTHGSCARSGDVSSCVCNGGYEMGHDAGLPSYCVDRCSSSAYSKPCSAGQTCVNHETWIECRDPLPDPCADDPCPANAICIPNGRSYRCKIVRPCDAAPSFDAEGNLRPPICP